MGFLKEEESVPYLLAKRAGLFVCEKKNGEPGPQGVSAERLWDEYKEIRKKSEEEQLVEL